MLASTVEMSGGVLDADESLTVSGVLTQSGDTTIDVVDNKTLTYSGAPAQSGGKHTHPDWRRKPGQRRTYS